VPKVRPREYSLPVSQIIETIKQSVALGYKEVVLTGTKVGSYKDSAVGLTELVQYILDNTGVERLRLSSLQPGDLSPQLLRLWQDERLCRHFHLALQSGSQSVLQRMMRGYSLDEYCRAIDLIKEAVAGAAITTDIMVGFPGESEHEFEESYSFCERAGFANIHVFPFSPRPGTIAAGMPSQIDEKVKKTRSQRMLQLAQRSRRLYCDKFLGQTLPVLWERETKLGSNVYSGLTTNYIRVYARSKIALTNKVIPAKLTAFHGQEMWGEIVI
jgi:threonylcarbamoyladenosine tRNA methylthiotransferase MtaB